VPLEFSSLSTQIYKLLLFSFRFIVKVFRHILAAPLTFFFVCSPHLLHQTYPSFPAFTASAFRAICSRPLLIRHALALSVGTFTEIAAIAVLHTTYFSDYRTQHYCKLSLQALAFV
jgi:hypothetical protein